VKSVVWAFVLAAGCGGLKLPDKPAILNDQNVAKVEEAKHTADRAEAMTLRPQAKAAGVVPAKADGSTFIGTADYPPYATEPFDPFVGVDGDEPFRLTEDEISRWRVREDDFACTAAVDHCLLGNQWLLEQDADRDRGGTARNASAYGFGPTEPVRPGNAHSAYIRENYTAYRTVPATKKNLTPGTLAFVLSFPAKHPGSGRDAQGAMWNVGKVAKVDWDMGFVFLEGHKKQFWLSATRVGVMSWRPGEKIQILGGKKREELAVAKGDVILP
jgi:hypothetical protein